jgi:CRISPR-associated exonuclease Cas4
LPPPANDGRCRECSLKEICQPEAVAAIDKLRKARQRLFDAEQ